MVKSFRSIKFPTTYMYSSDSEHIPLEFYEDAFPIAKNIDLLLGYFSSNAFKILSKSMAEFIFNGGEMRVITNHVLSLKDKENLISNTRLDKEDEVISIFEDIEKLELELSEYGRHFFDCLKYLLNSGRLKILPVKFNDVDLAHSKKMILFDGEDYLSTDGSINFTLSALTKNSESFQVNAPWKNEIFEERTKREIINFNRIFNKEHPEYTYIDEDQIETVINKIGRSKDVADLLDDSLELLQSSFGNKVKKVLEKRKERFEYKLNDLKGLPRFPFPTGPREYQLKAYSKWKENGHKGLFAMATGTGKTITSLNFVLNEYRNTNRYNFLVLVPTLPLLGQWIKEIKSFNFKSVYSTNDKNWNGILSDKLLASKLNLDSNIAFVSTYQSFNSPKFQRLISNDGWRRFILIADEAHNMGAKNTLKNLPFIFSKRIGLSATPERIYDEAGSKQVFEYFESSPPCYTFSYSMYKAIHSQPQSLTNYYYFPYFASLNEQELLEYKEISKRIFHNYDSKTNELSEFGKRLLIKRKRIVNRASMKTEVLSRIFDDIHRKEKNMKFTFVYVPEGFEQDSHDENEDFELESKRLINNYAEIIRKKGYRTHQMLGETKRRDEILQSFRKGDIDVLLAMKVLDEGVDVPATRNAVFCSSTGNPRQYIQRRGRVLRLNKGKNYANIYDIIIAPNDDYLNSLKDDLKQFEISIFSAELKRVANFLYAAENTNQIIAGELGQVSDKFGINLTRLIEENLKKDKKCLN